jgi:fluoroquinolone resistance protein
MTQRRSGANRARENAKESAASMQKRTSAPISPKTEYFSQTYRGLDLAQATLSANVFDECEFRECNFSEAVLEQCKFVDCAFNDCNLSLVKVTGSRFLGIRFTGCKLVGVDWTRATWPTVAVRPQLEFDECILNDSSFFGLDLQEMVVKSCKAHEVDFREGDFSGANFQRTDLRHCLFGRTNLAGADLTEATSYDIDIGNNNVQKAKFSRLEATRLLEGLGIEIVD